MCIFTVTFGVELARQEEKFGKLCSESGAQRISFQAEDTAEVKAHRKETRQLG